MQTQVRVRASSLRLADFRHEGSSAAAPYAGISIWASGGPSGFRLGWKWIDIGRGCIVIDDPASIVSSAVLIDDGGAPLSRTCTVLILHWLVQRLPWQGEAWRALRHLTVPQQSR